MADLDWSLPDFNTGGPSGTFMKGGSPDYVPMPDYMQFDYQTGEWVDTRSDVGTEPGWSNATTQVPGVAQPYSGGLPNFFKDLPSQFGNISPVGMAALIKMFGNANFQNAPTKEYTQTPGVKGTYEDITDETGKVTGQKELTPEIPAVMKNTSWAIPDLPSAQAYKQMQAGGALSPFEAYLDLQGEAIKQQFMNQAKAAWAPSTQRSPVEWRIPKI